MHLEANFKTKNDQKSARFRYTLQSISIINWITGGLLLFFVAMSTGALLHPTISRLDVSALMGIVALSTIIAVSISMVIPPLLSRWISSLVFSRQKGRWTVILAVACIGLGWMHSVLLKILVPHFIPGAAEINWIELPLRNTAIGTCIILNLIYGLTILLQYNRQAQSQIYQIEKSLVDFEVQMMRGKFDSHFLFNSLSILIALVQEDKVAVRVIHGFANFLRYSLMNRKQSLIPFGKEIDAVIDFIGIEKERSDGQIRFEMDFAAPSKGILVPGTFLQPLVENAIKYGQITGIEEPKIKIGSYFRGDILIIYVTNRGQLYTSDSSVDKKWSTSYGHECIRRHLEIFYPGYSEFEISEEQGWVTAEIRIRISNKPVSKKISRTHREFFKSA